MRLTQKNADALIAELKKLKAIFPKLATPGWLSKMAHLIWALEGSGATRFGGPEILAWWLVQRCMPRARLTKARIATLVRMSGRSQKTLDLLVALDEERWKPSRHDIGWNFLQVNSYLTRCWAERAR